MSATLACRDGHHDWCGRARTCGCGCHKAERFVAAPPAKVILLRPRKRKRGPRICQWKPCKEKITQTQNGRPRLYCCDKHREYENRRRMLRGIA